MVEFDRHRREKEAVTAALVELERRCFSDPWSEASFRESLSMENIHLLTVGDPIAAYLMFLSVPPEGEILNLAVCPERRRQGLGASLLGALYDACRKRGIDTLYLEVRASNTAALALYEGQGFVRAGLRRRYYRYPTEDAVLMVKTSI